MLTQAERQVFEDLGIQLKPSQFQAVSLEAALKACSNRVTQTESPFTIDAIHWAENEVDANIEASMKNTVQIDIQFASVATHNDRATNLSGTQIKPKSLAFPPPPQNEIILNHHEGAAITDSAGTLLAIRIPNALSFIHDHIMDAGHQFSHAYRFKKDSGYRPDFMTLESPLFLPGQVHYAYWQGVGGYANNPKISLDSQRQEGISKEFHLQCESFYHTLNIYMERIAPNTAKCSQEIWKNIQEHRLHGEALEDIRAHFFSHAVHFNSAPHIHTDYNSCWAGFDAIGVIGQYEGGRLFFPELGHSFPSRPGDLFFIRGAALMHDCIEWDGSGPEDGRMVFAMFADRRVFFREHIHRPQDIDPIYGHKAYKVFRNLYPLLDV